MSNFRDVTFGERLFSKIDDNEYLQKLYHNILINYSKRLFRLDEMEEKAINIGDALIFADVLSKSCGTNLSDIHKTRAQEMVALLYDMYPQNEQVKYYLGSVLANTGNFLGMKRLTPEFENTSFLEEVFMHFNMKYLSVPSEKDIQFFPAQKDIYDSLSKSYLSYSAPTSMGKSFMMRVFIKQQIKEGEKKNFALLIPTKALINEVASELIESLTTLLKETDYRIVTSSGSMALETKHNYIIIFASPNIPNPQVYLQTLSKGKQHIDEDSTVTCRYAPVSQLKYIVDLYERNIRFFDSYSRKFILLHEMSRPYSLSEIIARIGDRKHNIVYCKSKGDAIQFAQDYCKTQNVIDSKRLRTLSEAIRNDVHKEYYLADLVLRGVAYHIGYLPANIRIQLEDYYREGLIKTMFCTSTLLEGVNLPAENLFITSYKKGLSSFSEVDFKNLVGRVGRAKYNLYGNVFIVRLQRQEHEKDLQKFENLLKNDVPPQKLSVETELNPKQKKLVVNTLLSGSVEIHKSAKQQSEDNYELMRKTMLILVGDIVYGRNSCIRREFSVYLTPEIEKKIYDNFSVAGKKPNDDINVSYDQIQGIEKLISGVLAYPEIKDPKRGAEYNETLEFLNNLAVAFKWHIYEYQTLGAGDGQNYSKLSWYTVLLIQWMQGHGLSYIINKSIEDYEKKKRKVKVDYVKRESFNGSQEHKNIIIADTLEAIEDVLLFRLSNYFLKFSEEYKRQHPNQPLMNNWYEFVEYGTTNRLRIILQRSGFKRKCR